MDEEDHLKSKIKELNSQQKTLEKEENTIRKNAEKALTQELLSNSKAKERLDVERSLLMEELIKDRGIDGFINDVEFAEMAYKAIVYDRSRRLFGVYYETVISKLPYVTMHYFHNPHHDYSRWVPNLEILLVRNADATVFGEVAEKLSKLHMVHLEIMKGSEYPEISIEINSDNINFRKEPNLYPEDPVCVEWDEKNEVWKVDNGVTHKTLHEVFDWALAKNWVWLNPPPGWTP